MVNRLKPSRQQTTWLMGLLLAGLLLVACGGATETASSSTAPAAASPTIEEVADTPTAIQPTTAPATTESETAKNENPPDPTQSASNSGPAMCHTSTPQNDPIVGALQPNPLIAQVTTEEWSKGPADAPVTFIEYGDFQ